MLIFHIVKFYLDICSKCLSLFEYLRFSCYSYLPSFRREALDRAGSLEKETQEAAQRYSRGENRSLTVFVSIQLSSVYTIDA